MANSGERHRRLSLQKVRKQNGQPTLGVEALNPKTQRSPWVAIDADYENALEDLLRLQWEVRQVELSRVSKSPLPVLNSGSSPTTHCLQGTGQARGLRGEKRTSKTDRPGAGVAPSRRRYSASVKLER